MSCKYPEMSAINKMMYGVKLKTAEAANCRDLFFSTSAKVFLPTFLSVEISIMECVYKILTTQSPTATDTTQTPALRAPHAA